MTPAPMLWPALERPPPFVQAHDWRWLNRTDVRQIYIHTAECSESRGSASAVAHWFGTRRDTPGSSHLVIDASEVWECVKPQHEAFGAKGGNANLWGYHIELAGRASQTPVQWDDAFSRGELALAARAAACVAAHYGIPALKLGPDGVARGDMGFAGHLDATRAWNVRGGHVDPGIGFPWASFLEAVRRAIPVAGAAP